MKFNAVVKSYGLATSGDTVHHRIVLIAEKVAFDPSELVKSFGQEMTVEMKPRQTSMDFGQGAPSPAKPKTKAPPVEDKDQRKMPLDDEAKKKTGTGSGRAKKPRPKLNTTPKPPHPKQLEKTKVA